MAALLGTAPPLAAASPLAAHAASSALGSDPPLGFRPTAAIKHGEKLRAPRSFWRARQHFAKPGQASNQGPNQGRSQPRRQDSGAAHADSKPPPSLASMRGKPEALGPPKIDPDAPFPSHRLSLSAVLQMALRHNPNLAQRAIDVAISEENILAALGEFDVIANGEVGINYQKQTPRGSTFMFSTGSSAQRLSLGIRKKLRTGGSFDLSLSFDRSLTDQPINFFDPRAGSATLAQYIIQPRLQFTHPLLRGMGIRVNQSTLEQSKIAQTQARAQAQQDTTDLVRDILLGYWDLVAVVQDLEIRNAAVSLAQTQLERTQAQIEAGRLAPVDEHAVAQSLANKESQVIATQTQLLNQSLALRSKIGRVYTAKEGQNDLAVGIIPTTRPEHPTFARPPLQAQIRQTLQSHPQVRQLELALASKRLDDLRSANERLPQLDFQLSANARGRSADATENRQNGRAASHGSWGEAFRNFFGKKIKDDGLLADYSIDASLRWSWNMQNRAARGRHRRVQREYEQAQLNLSRLRQDLSAEVIRQNFALRAGQKRMEVAHFSIDLAQKNLRAEEARFEVGRSTNYDVLARIDELAQAQSQALSARIECLKAQIQLQHLRGELLPRYGIEIASDAP